MGPHTDVVYAPTGIEASRIWFWPHHLDKPGCGGANPGGEGEGRKESGRAEELGRARPHGKSPGPGEVQILLGLRDAARGGTDATASGSLTRTLPETWFRAGKGSGKSTKVGSSTDE